MSLEAKVVLLAQAIGADVKALRVAQGDLSTLTTTAKNNLVNAINELKALVGTGGLQIDDTAGAGATGVTWSADHSLNAINVAVTAMRDSLLNGAGAAWDTFKELQDLLVGDATLLTTLATQMGLRVRVDDVQTFTTGQKTQARSNIDAVGIADIGDTEHDYVADYTTAKA